MRVSRVSSLRGDGVGGLCDARPLRFEARFDGSDATGYLSRVITSAPDSAARQRAVVWPLRDYGIDARAARFRRIMRGKGNKTKKRGGRAQGAWLQRVGATLRLIPSFF